MHAANAQVLFISDHRDSFVCGPRIKDWFGHVDVAISDGVLSFDYFVYVLSRINEPRFFIFGNRKL